MINKKTSINGGKHSYGAMCLCCNEFITALSLEFRFFGFSFGLYFSYHTCLCRVRITIQTKKSRFAEKSVFRKRIAMQVGVLPLTQKHLPRTTNKYEDREVLLLPRITRVSIDDHTNLSTLQFANIVPALSVYAEQRNEKTNRTKNQRNKRTELATIHSHFVSLYHESLHLSRKHRCDTYHLTDKNKVYVG